MEKLEKGYPKEAVEKYSETFNKRSMIKEVIMYIATNEDEHGNQVADKDSGRWRDNRRKAIE